MTEAEWLNGAYPQAMLDREQMGEHIVAFSRCWTSFGWLTGIEFMVWEVRCRRQR
jgi:hypothetical protein